MPLSTTADTELNTSSKKQAEKNDKAGRTRLEGAARRLRIGSAKGNPKPIESAPESAENTKAKRTELLKKLDSFSPTASTTANDFLEGIVHVRVAKNQFPSPKNTQKAKGKRKQTNPKTDEQKEELAEQGLRRIAGRSPKDYKFHNMNVPMMRAVATEVWQASFPATTDRKKAQKKFITIWKKQLEKEAKESEAGDSTHDRQKKKKKSTKPKTSAN